MVLRIAVGERVAAGDIARMPASTVSKASAASPVRITIALASDTLDDLENRPRDCFDQRALVVFIVFARRACECGLGVGHGTALQCRLTMWK